MGLQTIIKFGYPFVLCHIKIKRIDWLVEEGGTLKIKLLKRLMLKEERVRSEFGSRNIRNF